MALCMSCRTSGGAVRQALLLLAALLVFSAGLGASTAGAVVEVPFATQFATSVRGGGATAANTLMTCPEAAANCVASRAGTATGAALNNNAYAMERVDVDGDLTTFDSSSATLALPAGATVQFAGLYYGARTSKGTGGEAATNAAASGTVLLRTPPSPQGGGPRRGPAPPPRLARLLDPRRHRRRQHRGRRRLHRLRRRHRPGR